MEYTEKLNNNINTDGNEMAPFLHSDGNTLFSRLTDMSEWEGMIFL